MGYDMNQHERYVVDNTPQQEPLTSQISELLTETEKMVENLSTRLNRAADKMFGGKPEKLESGNKNQVESCSSGMIEQLMRQSKSILVLLGELESEVCRIEQL